MRGGFSYVCVKERGWACAWKKREKCGLNNAKKKECIEHRQRGKGGKGEQKGRSSLIENDCVC